MAIINDPNVLGTKTGQTNRTFGTANYDPNAGVPVIPVSQIGSNIQPMTFPQTTPVIPPKVPTSPAQTNPDGTPVDQVQASKDTATSFVGDSAGTKKQLADDTASFQTLMDAISGKGATQAKYEEDSGAVLNRQIAADIGAQKLEEQAFLRNKLDQISNQPGIARDFVSDQLQGAARASSKAMADLDIREMAALKRADALQKAVERRVDLEYAPLEQKRDYYKDLIKKNEDKLSQDDKNRLEIAYKEYDRKLDEQKSEASAVFNLGAEAAKNGAPADITQAILSQKDKSKALALAGLYLRDPLEDQYKRAQINKIYQDIESDKVKNDPSVQTADVMAYAAQYAATGELTGIPKELVGQATRVAAELPKNNGAMVNTQTGVAPKDSKFVDANSALYDLTKKLDEAHDLFETLQKTGQTGVGVVSPLTLGVPTNLVKNTIFPSTTMQSYNTLRGEIIDLLARARTGAAISANEEKLYGSKLPTKYNQAFFIGPDGLNQINGLKSSIAGKLDTNLASNQASIYGYTKVAMPNGQTYTVGDVVEGPNGLKGRVNPNGTITVIE